MATNSIEQFAEQTNDFLSLVNTQLKNINEIVAKTALTIIKTRIKEDGLNSKGSKLGSYSDSQVPFFFTKGGKKLAPYSSGAISGGAESSLAALKKGGAISLSYKEWRELNGLQTKFIDLTFTGSMWKDIDVISNDVKGQNVVTIVSAKDTATRKGGQTTSDIMSFNAERFGDFLSVSEQEEKRLADVYDAELQRLINQAFGK
jgi:hypothetical protein